VFVSRFGVEVVSSYPILLSYVFMGCADVARHLVSSACISHKPTTTSKRFRNTTSRTIGHGMFSHPCFPCAYTDNALEWNNFKKPSAKCAKSSACANNAATLSRRRMSRKPACCRRTIPRNIVVVMVRWLV